MSKLRSSVHFKFISEIKYHSRQSLSRSHSGIRADILYQTGSPLVVKRFIRMAPQTQAGEPVVMNGRKYRAIKEGLASILAPYREERSDENRVSNPKQPQQPKNRSHNNDEGDQAVFYNPIQQYNRDLSVLAFLTFGEGSIVEKREKQEKKFKGKERARKSKNAPKQNIADSNGSVSQVDVSKKRKADEIEEGGDSNVDVEGAKRVRSEEAHDGSDELEVSELLGGPEVEIQVTASGAAPQDIPSHTNTTEKMELTKKLRPPPFTILDALSASGLRAIRYAKEIPFATNVVANDLSAEAVKSIDLNIEHNQVQGKVHSNVGDARAYMYSKVGNESQHPTEGYVHRFDVVDLDPYGTAAPFLDSALQALIDGGLLAVTCTDAGVFASNGYPEKAFALYDGVPMKGPYSHEAGLRLILHSIATSAAKYGIAIEPLLSLSIDFYARMFIRVHKSPAQVKLLAGTTMITYNCDYGCGAWNTQLIARNQAKDDKNGNEYYKHTFAQAPTTTPLCSHCNSKMHLGGPMWAGPLHNPYFVQRILDKLPYLDSDTYGTIKRIEGMLTLALEEDLTLASSNTNSNDHSGTTSKSNIPPSNPAIIPPVPPSTIDSTPFFFIPNTLAKVLHCSTPPEDSLRGAIRSQGYLVTRSHCKPGSFKTNAPWDILWEIMREWIRQKSPVKADAVKPNTPGWRIMQKARGSEAKAISDISDNIKKLLEKGISGKEDLKTLLQSALYELDHPDTTSTLKSKDTSTTNPPTTTEPKISLDPMNVTTSATAPAPAAPTTTTAFTSSTTTPQTEYRDVSKLTINFDQSLGREKPRDKLVRYQINPRANWGPMNRAG